jgi:hypothetical protein
MSSLLALGLRILGVTFICLDAHLTHRSLTMKANKTDLPDTAALPPRRHHTYQNARR